MGGLLSNMQRHPPLIKRSTSLEVGGLRQSSFFTARAHRPPPEKTVRLENQFDTGSGSYNPVLQSGSSPNPFPKAGGPSCRPLGRQLGCQLFPREIMGYVEKKLPATASLTPGGASCRPHSRQLGPPLFPREKRGYV